MNPQVCVNCNNKKPVNLTTNRLVTESCGHVKCMDCLLHEKAGCAACLRDGSDQEVGEVPMAEDESEEPAKAYDASVEIPETAKENQTEIEDLCKKVKPETSHVRIETDGNGRYFVCTLCKKKFHARSQVAYHAYCNGQRKPYQCPDCNKSFAALSHFKYHMSVHRNERTYACDVCGDSFFQMSKLQRHKLKHTKEKKHACIQCNKAFNNVSSLRKHALTHTEERPYACVVCQRRFRDSSNYRKHLTKHEETEFACTVCGIKLECRRALAEHARAAHAGVARGAGGARRPHQCPRCPQAFHSGKDMRRHAAVHSDSKPFRCKVCNRRFRRKDNLERHIRNTHPDCDAATVVECDESALKEIVNAKEPQEKNTSEQSYQNAEKAKLEILNPLPPLPQEVIQKHLDSKADTKEAPASKEVNENISQNSQEEVTFIDKSYILEANNARESVIVGKWNAGMERKVVPSPVPEYVHKIRRANSIACRKDVLLPPIDERKLIELETKNHMNNLDVGAPVKNMEIYKKILFERMEKDTSVQSEDEVKMHQTSPKLHWRRKLKLNINCVPSQIPNVSSVSKLNHSYLPLQIKPGLLKNMEDNFVNSVLTLYKEKDWKTIVNKYREYPDRNRLLWVFPTEENFVFLRHCLLEANCERILSIGCGSGLLEWMITEATGFDVSGVEVDGVWWRCKYAPPTFIPLLLTPQTLEEDTITLLTNSHSTALLFCYFNNGQAFRNYMKHFTGKLLIIIGPGVGKGVHTDPKPFDNVPGWTLHADAEVGNTKDYISVYWKSKL